ncbi:DNA-binding GntR family transcriptional regulator [Kibdelosporangium banguiense]|uniref:DNA-binding GntR family transcriptional regulator n=1 Tax=Kibdelosporangium banguiense TaxID=1365924 RepID=A0ABS4TGK6_9PSEU|nr:GntR family transcriptional regulator [Kibdelosporangium banguiense]MBP2323003.1 DNA-binding GntR family transcriptional regulator [Kibdelosporangium banguiense]
MSAPKRPPTAQEFVLAELRRAILTGEMAPGTPIRQDALAEHLGVSRVPLREALRTLEGEGQVIYRPHRGYHVADLSLDDLLEVYRIRELLETEATLRAVPLMTPEDIDRLEQSDADIQTAAAANDIVGMAAANRQFHFTVLEASGMPRLTRLVRVLWDATDAYRSLYYSSPANRDRVHSEHKAIIAAIRSGSADEVVRLWNQHRAGAVDALRQIVQ